MKRNVILTASFLAIVIAGFALYSWSQNSSNLPSSPQNNSIATQDNSTSPSENQPIAPISDEINQQAPMEKHLVTIKTSMGDITFATYDGDVPNTVKNFITLAQKGFYNGVIFHRVIKGFMIQGGDPTGTGTGGPGYTFPDELDPKTPSYQAGYIKGVVAMANAGPNTNGSQFFIMLADTPLPHNYTIFGKVTKGQDVVNAIGNLPTDQNDRPLNPPKIESVSIADGSQ